MADNIVYQAIRALYDLTQVNQQSAVYNRAGLSTPIMVQIIQWTPPIIQGKTTLELIDTFNSEKCSLYREYVKYDIPGRTDIRAERIMMMIKLCEQTVSELKYLISELASRAQFMELLQTLSEENKELIGQMVILQRRMDALYANKK